VIWNCETCDDGSTQAGGGNVGARVLPAGMVEAMLAEVEAKKGLAEKGWRWRVAGSRVAIGALLGDGWDEPNGDPRESRGDGDGGDGSGYGRKPHTHVHFSASSVSTFEGNVAWFHPVSVQNRSQVELKSGQRR